MKNCTRVFYEPLSTRFRRVLFFQYQQLFVRFPCIWNFREPNNVGDTKLRSHYSQQGKQGLIEYRPARKKVA